MTIRTSNLRIPDRVAGRNSLHDGPARWYNAAMKTRYCLAFASAALALLCGCSSLY